MPPNKAPPTGQIPISLAITHGDGCVSAVRKQVCPGRWPVMNLIRKEKPYLMGLSTREGGQAGFLGGLSLLI